MDSQNLTACGSTALSSLWPTFLHPSFVWSVLNQSTRKGCEDGPQPGRRRQCSCVRDKHLQNLQASGLWTLNDPLGKVKLPCWVAFPLSTSFFLWYCWDSWTSDFVYERPESFLKERIHVAQVGPKFTIKHKMNPRPSMGEWMGLTLFKWRHKNWKKLISLATKEINMKTTLRFHLILAKMPIAKEMK